MALVHFIQDNFWPKAFSLILATFIWLVVNSNVQNKTVEVVTPSKAPVSRNFSRKITMHWLGSGDVPATRLRPDSVQLTLTGEPAILESVRSDEIQAFVEITAFDVIPGIFPVQVRHPRGISPSLVLPCAVRVEARPLAEAPNSITDTNRVQSP